MHQIDGLNVAAVKPAKQPVGPVVGWFRGKGINPKTQVTGDFLNSVLDEFKNAIEDAGIELDKEDDSQLSQAIKAGLFSGPVSVGAVTNLHVAGVAVSENCGAFGDRSIVMASVDGDVNGDTSAMIACDLSAGSSPGVTGDSCALIACDGFGGLADLLGVGNAGLASRDPLVAGLFSAIVGSSTSEVNATGGVIVGSANSKIVPVSGTAPQNVTMLASRYCSHALGANTTAARTYAVSGGYHASTLTAPSWRLESNGGTMRSTAAHTTSGLDYAEMFENLDKVPHEPGQIITLSGDGCRLATRRERMLGGVSVNPTVLGGDDGIAWAGRYLRDVFGGLVMEDVEVESVAAIDWTSDEAKAWLAAKAALDAANGTRSGLLGRFMGSKRRAVKAAEAALAATPYPTPAVVRETVRQARLDPDWDPTREQVSRRDRPAAWTAVGLLGQLRIRVDADVVAGDWLSPGAVPGQGEKADRDYLEASAAYGGVSMRVMKIVQSFDEALGYAVAQVLVR